jgi:TolB-like protein
LAAGLAGVAVAAVCGWWLLGRHSAPIPIAVLPLINLNQDPATDYFADGLTGEIIRNLSIIDGLAVRSQTSSFAFKGKSQNVRDAARQLGVDYVVEGSVLESGQQLRINAQLVRVRDDSPLFPLWSGKYDRESTDVFAIQDEISRGIVNVLRLKLRRGRRRYETSVEAYDLYLRARAVSSPSRVQETQPAASIDLFEQALAKDPSFAPAYAGLAGEHAMRSGYRTTDRSEEMSNMRAAAEKAIQLDPLLAEAHDALGVAYARDAHWEQSEKSFRRALELDASSSLSHHHFAQFLLLPLGRIEEAVAQSRIAEKTDPLSPEIQFWSAYALLAAGRFEEAAAHCERLPAGSTRKFECQGRALLGRGKIDEVIRTLEERFSGRFADSSAGYLGYAYGRAGRREEAEKVAAVNPRLLDQALISAGLGDKDRTFEALDRMIPLGPIRIGWALTSPEFALVRGDPRVKLLRMKVGLPE